jgi:hypothetical protein
MVDEYTKSLEEENEKLREKLAAVQLELDELTPKKNYNTIFDLKSMNSGFLNCNNLQGFACTGTVMDEMSTKFSLCGVDLCKEDIENMVEVRKLQEAFLKASLWKKIKMLLTMVFTKKNLKTE